MTQDESFAGTPSGAMPCKPNQVGSFSRGGSFTAGAAAVHHVQYFTPVAALASNGQTNGAFQRPAKYTFGSVENNYNFGPSLFTADMTLKKQIPLHDQISMGIEAMAMNVFNHANFANPGGTCIDCTGSNGQITDIVGGTFAGMRNMQFAAHINF